MRKLDYHEFYEDLWLSEDFISIISDEYIDKEEDFIREWTKSIYRQYDLKFNGPDHMSFKSIKKLFEITFSTLALFEPKTKIRPTVPKDSKFPFRNEF